MLALRTVTYCTENEETPRCTGLGALGQDLLLELGAVAPTGLVLGFGHGVHLSGLVDTIVAAYAAALKGGMTVRLRRFSVERRMNTMARLRRGLVHDVSS